MPEFWRLREEARFKVIPGEVKHSPKREEGKQRVVQAVFLNPHPLCGQ